MANSKKRFLSWLVAASLALSLLPASALAADEEQIPPSQESGTEQVQNDPVDPPAEGNPADPPADPTDPTDPPVEEDPIDLSQVERPDQSQGVEDTRADVFYTEEDDTYHLNINISEDVTDTEVTVDLNKVMEELKKYAEENREAYEQLGQEGKEIEATKPAEPARPGLSEEDQAKMDQYNTDLATYERQLQAAREYLAAANGDNIWLDGSIKSNEKVENEIKSSWYTRPSFANLGEIPVVDPAPVMPDVTELDPDSDAYKTAMAEYEAKMTEYNKRLAKYQEDYAAWQARYDAAKKRAEADQLQPGDVRKFEITLSNGTKHTYVYKQGSFTLATPDFGQGRRPMRASLRALTARFCRRSMWTAPSRRSPCSATPWWT